MKATGWAVINNGKIDVRTISETRRAAIVNWIVVEKGIMVFPVTTDEQIERMWWRHCGVAEVAIVSIHSGANAKKPGTAEAAPG